MCLNLHHFILFPFQRKRNIKSSIFGDQHDRSVIFAVGAIDSPCCFGGRNYPTFFVVPIISRFEGIISTYLRILVLYLFFQRIQITRKYCISTLVPAVQNVLATIEHTHDSASAKAIFRFAHLRRKSADERCLFTSNFDEHLETFKVLHDIHNS